jgi:hypothetical protein
MPLCCSVGTSENIGLSETSHQHVNSSAVLGAVTVQPFNQQPLFKQAGLKSFQKIET